MIFGPSAFASPAAGCVDFKSESFSGIEQLTVFQPDYHVSAEDQTLREVTYSGNFNTNNAYKDNLRTENKLSPLRAINELLADVNYTQGQDRMTGGGTVTYDASSNLKWSSRFIVYGVDKNVGPSGYLEMLPPAAGTVIQGIGGTASVTVTSAGVPLATNMLLLAEHQRDSLGNRITYKVAIFNTTSPNQLKPNQILVAARNSDNNSLRLGTGQTLTLGQSMVDGQVMDMMRLQTASNIDVTINDRTRLMMLNADAQLGANRTVTLKDPVKFKEQPYWVANYNSSSFSQLTNHTLKDASGATYSALENRTVYQLIPAGDHSFIASKEKFPLKVSAAYSAGTIVNGTQASQTVTVAGARLGEVVSVSFGSASTGLRAFGEVTASNTVTVYIFNGTGSDKTYSGNLNISVL